MGVCHGAFPFRTIGHCAATVLPEGSCLIRGGTYRETVRPGSGEEHAPITFDAEQNEPVVISGANVAQPGAWEQVSAAHMGELLGEDPTLSESNFVRRGYADGAIYSLPLARPAPARRSCRSFPTVRC